MIQKGAAMRSAYKWLRIHGNSFQHPGRQGDCATSMRLAQDAANVLIPF
jgi:hypothetical protein